jgi:hypothetical protein
MTRQMAEHIVSNNKVEKYAKTHCVPAFFLVPKGRRMAIANKQPVQQNHEEWMADTTENSFVPRNLAVSNSEISQSGVSRRAVLKQVAALGAGAAFSLRPLFAEMPRVDSNPQRGRIDVHHHMLNLARRKSPWP